MLPNEMYDKIAFSMKYQKAIRISYWIHLKTSKINEKNKLYSNRYKILRKIHMKSVFKEVGYHAQEKLLFLLGNTGIKRDIQEIWLISRWYHHALLEDWVFTNSHHYNDFKKFIVGTCHANAKRAIQERTMAQKEGVKLLYYIRDYSYFMHPDVIHILIDKEYTNGRISARKLKKMIGKIPVKKQLALKPCYTNPIQYKIKYLELREAILKNKN
jgi:hypothetical protein